MTEIMLRVGEQGRIVIPSELRKQLGLNVGTELVARVESDADDVSHRLVLETRSAILARLQAQFTSIKESMADELIADRKNEVERELRD